MLRTTVPRGTVPDQAEQVAPLLKALADPVRLRLMSLVASHPGGEPACGPGRRVDLSQPTISHHLKVLHENGLLDREKRGVVGLLPGPRQGAGQPRRPDRFPGGFPPAFARYLTRRATGDYPCTGHFHRLSSINDEEPEPLDRADAETYASWFKALADGTRVQLVSLLARSR